VLLSITIDKMGQVNLQATSSTVEPFPMDSIGFESLQRSLSGKVLTMDRLSRRLGRASQEQTRWSSGDQLDCLYGDGCQEEGDLAGRGKIQKS
jgi:hypothetical protein